MAAASKRLTLPNKLSSLAYDSKTFEICELGRLPPAPRLLFTSEHHAPSCGGTLVTRAIPELPVPFLLLPVVVRIPDTVFQMLKCYTQEFYIMLPVHKDLQAEVECIIYQIQKL